MISVIITAYKEERTIKKCIKSITNQGIKDEYEIIIIAPDEKTLKTAKSVKSEKVKTYKDEGIGKFNALNLGFKKAKGSVLILIDGDTYLGENSVNEVVKKFQDENTGIVSGRVKSVNPRGNKLGYWSHLLTNAAHKERVKRSKKKEFIICTGYLIGLRKGIIQELPKDLLAEDAYMSHYVWSKGYDTVYAPKAEVFVKYPTNFKDWIKQKRRSAGGYHQLNQYFENNPRMRSFLIEIIKGPVYALTYARSIKEFIWSLELFPARVYLWLLTFYDKITRKDFKQVWKRVESTK